MNQASRRWCAQTGLPAPVHFSVIAVWLITAWVSWFDRHGFGMELLVQSGIEPVALRHCLIAAGVVWDILIGLGLLCWPSRPMYRLALAGMVVMTVLATLLQPALWWHPLGPLFKNIPIAAIVWWGGWCAVAKPGVATG